MTHVSFPIQGLRSQDAVEMNQFMIMNVGLEMIVYFLRAMWKQGCA